LAAEIGETHQFLLNLVTLLRNQTLSISRLPHPVNRTEKHRKLTNSATLLRRWAAYHQYDRINKFLEYNTFEREVDKFIRELASLKNQNYALTVLTRA
jgi:hypothetical protein